MQTDGIPEQEPAARATGARAPLLQRVPPSVRGLVSAYTLGAYSVAGFLGAVLALLPAALRPVPRGRAGAVEDLVPEPSDEASREFAG